MENGRFEDVFPIKNRKLGYSIAMLVYQRVYSMLTSATGWISLQQLTIIHVRSEIFGLWDSR